MIDIKKKKLTKTKTLLSMRFRNGIIYRDTVYFNIIDVFNANRTGAYRSVHSLSKGSTRFKFVLYSEIARILKYCC